MSFKLSVNKETFTIDIDEFELRSYLITVLQNKMTKIAVQPAGKDGERVSDVTPTEVHQLNRVSNKWYILSIVATLLFCPLFGLMGLSHSMFAVHNGELGNTESQRKWIKKTKIFTGIAFALGTLFYLITIGVLIDIFCWYCFYGSGYYSSGWCGTDDLYPYGNYTIPMSTPEVIIN